MPDPFARRSGRINGRAKEKTFCAPHQPQKVLVVELLKLPYPMCRVLHASTVLTAHRTMKAGDLLPFSYRDSTTVRKFKPQGSVNNPQITQIKKWSSILLRNPD